MVKTKKERLEYILNWAKNNPEKVKSSRKKYKLRHKEQIREYNRTRYVNIKDRKNERRRNKRRNDPNFSGITWKYSGKWKIEHPEEWKQIKKEYHKKHYESNKEDSLQKMHNYLSNRRREVLYWYSNGEMKCSRCGETHIEFLAVDHIHNNGRKERKENPGNAINYIIRNNFPDEYQVLCHNCNFIKRAEVTTRKTPSAAYHKFRDKIKNMMLNKYSHGSMKCECCGFADPRALSFNHINKQNAKSLRPTKGPLMLFLYKNNVPTSEINVLCMNCNSADGYYGKCPHKSE
jgi:hypothetical protein